MDQLPGDEIVDESTLETVENEAPAKAEKTPKAPKATAGPKISGHQKNRQLALAAYGDPTYTENDFRLEFTNPADRERATADLQEAAESVQNKKSAMGADRYLIWVKRQGFPEGMMTVVYPEELESRKLAKRVMAVALREAQQAEKDEKRAAKKAKTAEKHEARQAFKAEKIAAAAEAKAEAKQLKAAKKAKKESLNGASEYDPADGEFQEL